MKRSIAFIAALLISVVAQAVPNRINYQGTLLDNNNIPVTATKTFVVEIFSAATGGTALFTETHTGVVVDDGVFSFQIGANTTLPASLFDTSGDRYLQLTVNGEVMSPRIRFLSAPFTLQANNSQTLSNFPPAYFASASALNALQNQVNNLQIPSAKDLCQANFGAVWIDSIGLCFGGAVDATERDLNKKNLTGARLRNAKLDKTNLSQTLFRHACIFNSSVSIDTNFAKADFFGTAMVGLDLGGTDMKTTLLAGLYTDGLVACPGQGKLPEGWDCVTASEMPKTYRLVGPGAAFSARCDLPNARWDGVRLPPLLLGADFSNNLFRNCTLQEGTNFKNANLFGAKFIGCSVYGPVTFDNTTCPDGTNSADAANDGTCFGHGVPTRNK